MTERSLLTMRTWAENVAQTLCMFLDREVTLGTVGCNVTSPFEIKARFKGNGVHLLLTLSNGLSGGALISVDLDSAARLFPGQAEDQKFDRDSLLAALTELSGLLSGTLSTAMALPVPVAADGELRDKPANLNSPLLASFEIPLQLAESGTATMVLTLPAALCEAIATAGDAEATSEEAPAEAAESAPAGSGPPSQASRVNESSYSSERVMASPKQSSPELGILANIAVEVKVVLGRAVLSMEELLALSEGSLVELDKLADDPVDLFVRERKVANGDVVVIDERFGVKIRHSYLHSRSVAPTHVA